MSTLINAVTSKGILGIAGMLCVWCLPAQDLNIHAIGFFLPRADYAVISGQYVYAVDGQAGYFYVGDFNDPSHPKEVGRIQLGMWGNVKLRVAGSYAYACSSRWQSVGNLFVVDISNPIQPREISSLEVPNEIKSLAISGNYLFMAAASSGLLVFDISNPSQIRQTTQLALNLSAMDIVVSGSKAFVAEGREFGPSAGGLTILDISDPTRPVRLGGYETQYPAYTVTHSNQTVVVGCGNRRDSGRIYLLDVGNSIQPRLVSEIPLAKSVTTVAVDGDNLYYLWMTTSTFTGNGGLEAFNISNPAQPRLVGKLTHGDFFGGPSTYLSIAGSLAVGGGISSSVVSLDLNTPATLRQIGEYSTSGPVLDVDVSGSMVFLFVQRQGVQAVDAANPADIHPRGIYQNPNGIPTVAVQDHFIYTVDDSSRLVTLDVANPDQFRVLESSTNLSAHYLTVVSNQLFTVPSSGRLSIINLGNPAYPQLIGSVPMAAEWQGQVGIAVEGHYIYLANGWQLEIVDTRNIGNPVLPWVVGTWRGNMGGIFSPGPHHVISSGPYIYAIGGNRLVKVDVHNAASPSLVWEYILGSPLDLYQDGNYLYIADGWDGLIILDLSNPSLPRRVGGNNTFGAWRVKLSKGRVYLASPEKGLLIFEKFAPPLGPGNLLLNGKMEASGFKIAVTGPEGRTVLLQRTSSMAQPWVNWRTLTLSSESVQMVDPDTSTNGFMFYRATTP